MNKKGQVLDGLGALATGVVALMIVLVVGFLVIAQAETQGATIEGLDYSNVTQCASSATCTAGNTLTAAAATIPTWVPIVIITSIGALLIGLVSIFRRR